MKKIKNRILFIIYTMIIGAIAGLIIWTFLKAMSIGIEFFWIYLPKKINFKYSANYIII